MSKFKAFMNGENKIKTQQIVVSDRFLDDDGNAVPFVIRNLTSRELKSCRENATVKDELGISSLDNEKFELEIIKMGVVSPDLKDTELQDYYGVVGEVELLEEMLNAGEFMILTKALNELNNFNGIASKVEKAKN